MDRLSIGHIKASQTALSVGGSAWVEAIVGSTALPSRKWVHIFNRSPYKVYYSYNNTDTVLNCFALKAGGVMILPLSESIPVYLRSSQATGTLHIIVAEVS